MGNNNLVSGFLVAAAIVGLSGCSIHVGDFDWSSGNANYRVGEVQTTRLDIARPADKTDVYEVELSPGAANVKVDSKGTDVLNGAIEYNIEELKPIVTSSGNKVTVRTPEIRGTLPRNQHFDWDLSLGKNVPMDLTVNTGATEGVYDFGGLSLRSFTWRQGAAKANVQFSDANPLDMNDFHFDVGAAQLTMRGLGNANISDGTGSVGAGDVKLYFDGELSRDVNLTIESGAATVTIYSGGNPIRLTMDGALNTTQAGDWTKDGKVYTSPEWENRGESVVNIKVNMGIGTVKLVTGK